MSVKRFLKKILCILTYDRPITYALFLTTIFSIFVIQKSYCQEKNKIAKTTETVQQKDTPISFTPVLDKNGNIYIISHDGKLSAIDHNVNTKWYIQLADKINNGVIISSDDTLYFSSEKTLYAMGSNGALKWIFNAENTADPPPQSKTKPINEIQEQNTPQILSISHVIPEETQSFSKETGKPTTTSFEASIQKGTAPLTVKFSDTSTGKIVYRLWDFEAGSLTSSEQYPIHTYSKPRNITFALLLSGRLHINHYQTRLHYSTNTSASNSREIMTDLNGKNDEETPTSPSISKKHNDTKLYDSESLLIHCKCQKLINFNSQMV